MSDNGDDWKKEFESVTEEQIATELREASRGGEGWWEDRSLPVKVVMGIGFGILGVGLVFLFILVTKSLWNALMPEIFGLPSITYWQSAGLLALSCIFFKNCGGSGSCGRRSDRKRKRELRKYMDEKPGASL